MDVDLLQYLINSCVLSSMNLPHFTTWWQCWARNSSLFSQCFSQMIMTNGETEIEQWTINGVHLGTFWGTLGTLQVIYFLVFCVLGARNRPENAPLELWCHFWCTYAHPVMSQAWKQHYLVVGQTLRYTVSNFEVNPTDGSRVIGNFVHPL